MTPLDKVKGKGLKIKAKKDTAFPFALYSLLRRTAAIFGYAVAYSLYSPPAQACAVCFGNKDSLQTKGAVAGVLFLLAVISAVLVGLGITFIRWGARERALHTAQFGPPSSEPGHS